MGRNLVKLKKNDEVISNITDIVDLHQYGHGTVL